AEAAQQPLPGEQQARAAADVEAKRKAAEAEQQRLKEEEQRQAKAAADADARRKAAEAAQQQLAALRQAKAAADTDAKLKAAAAEATRLAALKAEQERKVKAEEEAAAGSTTGLFTIRSNTEASGDAAGTAAYVRSRGDCEQNCARSATCKVF